MCDEIFWQTWKKLLQKISIKYFNRYIFKIAFNELQRKTLQLVVFDFDRLSKDDRIGQLAIPLETVDFGVLVDEWKDLDPPVEDVDNVNFNSKFKIWNLCFKESRLGDICFSTRYRPATGTLTITIMEARNLKKMDVGGSSGNKIYRINPFFNILKF